MHRAILIGASGFIGRKLHERLNAAGIETLAVFHRNPVMKSAGTSVLSGGISALTAKRIDDFHPDIIYHCARPTFPYFRKNGRRIAAFRAMQLNKRLIGNLGSSLSRPRLVFLSGSLMYGNAERPHSEDSPLNPLSYAREYALGERPLIETTGRPEMKVNVVRLPWVLGNGSWFKWFYLDAMKRFGKIPVFGDRQNYMEIIDIEDVASFLLMIGRGSIGSGIINLPSQKAITQEEFVTLAGDVFNAGAANYRVLYGKSLERASIEAFTSNILLTTKHKELISGLAYAPLKATLERIREEALSP